MPRPPLPVFALLALAVIDGLRLFGAWLTDDADALQVAVLVVLAGVLVVLTSGGRQRA